jgi:hypothetical protein
MLALLGKERHSGEERGEARQAERKGEFRHGTQYFIDPALYLNAPSIRIVLGTLIVSPVREDSWPNIYPWSRFCRISLMLLRY